MKAYDFDAVTFDADIYCVECLPDGVDEDSDEVYPIFADSEWDYVPVCCVCGMEHDYVSVLEQEEDTEESEEEDENA
jgi:hypothetical protein